MAATAIAGLRGRLPGCEPRPYIIRFTEDKPNPLYRRVCYTVAWSAVLAFGFVHIGRGCVFRCTFCINSIHKDPTVRLRSVDKVIEEIKYMLSVCKNTNVIFFEDEIFPVRSSFLKEFCDKYKKEINIPFQIVIYPHMLSDEKILMLKSILKVGGQPGWKYEMCDS